MDIPSWCEPFDLEEGSIGATPAGLNQAKVALANFVYVIFNEHETDTGPVRYLVHGVDPTQTSGILLLGSDQRVFNKEEAQKLKMGRAGVTNGYFRAIYYKPKPGYQM